MRHDSTAFWIDAPLRTAMNAAEMPLFCRIIWRLAFDLQWERIWEHEVNGMEWKRKRGKKISYELVLLKGFEVER